MPAFDGSGPLGQGPQSGKGLGGCMSYVGFGRGRFGFKCQGLQRLFSPWRRFSKEEKVDCLKEYKQSLVSELEMVESQLKNPDNIK